MKSPPLRQLLLLLLPPLLLRRYHAIAVGEQLEASSSSSSSSSSYSAATTKDANERRRRRRGRGGGERVAASIDVDDGPSNLREGIRLVEHGQYVEASHHLWRAVLLQTAANDDIVAPYAVEDAFLPFLQCYREMGRMIDGLLFVSIEGYLRGQDDMGDTYLGEALRRLRRASGSAASNGDEDDEEDDGGIPPGGEDGDVRRRRDGDAASRLRRLVDSDEWRATSSKTGTTLSSSSWRYASLMRIRDVVDLGSSIDAGSSMQHRRGHVGGSGDDDDTRRDEDDDDDDDDDDNIEDHDKFWDQFVKDDRGGGGKKIESSSSTSSSSLTMSSSSDVDTAMSPEELFDEATRLFNNDERIEAGRLFEKSCILSKRKLHPACTNAIYIRSTICDWGYRGRGYEEDMRTIVDITIAETMAYRSEVVYRRHDIDDGRVGDLVVFGGDERAVRRAYTSLAGGDGGGGGGGGGGGVIDEIRRINGIGLIKKTSNVTTGSIHRGDDPRDSQGRDLLEFTHWTRSTSVHPHMMLGYLLPMTYDGNATDPAMVKRYAAESVAHMDEIRARIVDTGKGTTIVPLPPDMPYRLDEDLRMKFVKRHRGGGNTARPPPIKVGFVACSFNSKAVLYLSHDMFRFFDPDVVEIHVFSTGNPDSSGFIQGVMRGVDWRQRVIDTVDYFHDVRRYRQDHVGLARYIREQWEIEILIDWDGYARQGERAMGLMALRSAPIQILHQEFLMTSGAQYFDYIVTDMITSPPRLEKLYTEKFIYLPNHFFSKGHAVQREVLPPNLEYVPRKKGSASFQIGVGSPQDNACQSTNPLGGANNNEVSFVYCNFNKFLKNNPETMRSWIQILRDVPNSILCLLEYPKEGVANLRNFVTHQSTLAVDGENDGSNLRDDKSDVNDRIHFIKWEWNPFDHQQRTHSLCNSMLDSHPYNGHTTAQDAYFAGVPIVTRSDGDEMSSRVTTSANVVLGLEELNAYDGAREYERIAVRLGKDEAWFASIRARLVESCLRKNQMHKYWDVPRYVRNFERGLKMAWDNYLDGREIDYVMVREDGDEKLRVTMEDDLFAREERRKKREKHYIHDEL